MRLRVGSEEDAGESWDMKQSGGRKVRLGSWFTFFKVLLKIHTKWHRAQTPKTVLHPLPVEKISSLISSHLPHPQGTMRGSQKTGQTGTSSGLFPAEVVPLLWDRGKEAKSPEATILKSWLKSSFPGACPPEFYMPLIR